MRMIPRTPWHLKQRVIGLIPLFFPHFFSLCARYYYNIRNKSVRTREGIQCSSRQVSLTPEVFAWKSLFTNDKRLFFPLGLDTLLTLTLLSFPLWYLPLLPLSTPQKPLSLHGSALSISIRDRWRCENNSLAGISPSVLRTYRLWYRSPHRTFWF